MILKKFVDFSCLIQSFLGFRAGAGTESREDKKNYNGDIIFGISLDAKVLQELDHFGKPLFFITTLKPVVVTLRMG